MALGKSAANLGFIRRIVPGGILQLLKKDKNGINAAIIGEVTQDHPGKVVMKSRIGGRRVVNYLTGEQLPRIC